MMDILKAIGFMLVCFLGPALILALAVDFLQGFPGYF